MSDFFESDKFETRERPTQYSVYTKLSRPRYWGPALALFFSDVLSFADK